jgi:small subunit ribosomal protein S16
MRLRRVGAKKQPRYRVVIAQARAPRDGDFVDSIGFYDPLTEPATVRIDRDRALSWLSKGAQPSDTVQRLLRNAGIVEGAAPTSGSSEAPAAKGVSEEPVATASVSAEPAATSRASAEPATTSKASTESTVATSASIETADEAADGDRTAAD